MKNTSHFTTRRAFVAAAGFGGVSLYGLWAAYGAAPGLGALLGLDHAENVAHVSAIPNAISTAPAGAGAHAGHGAAMASGPSADEFSRMSADFSARFQMPDGSVYPRRLAAPPVPGDDPHAGHAGHSPAAPTGASAELSRSPIDVLMTAGKWYYLPNTLRLDAGQAYRFRMMALDVGHGASIQFGTGARMMRLQPGRVTETELVFQRPGRYLMHCTVYCGEAHDRMQATLEVV